MAFADWIPTIINVGSSLFGGNKAPEGAPSAPSSGIDWGAVLSGVGQLASRFEATPMAGATDKEIERANRYNLIAGLLGGGAQLVGSQMQNVERTGMLKDVSDILSGTQTTTGQPIAPTLAGTSATPTPIPTAGAQPQTKAEALYGLINKYPTLGKEIFQTAKSVQDAETKAMQSQQEQRYAAATQLGNLISRPNAGELPESVIAPIAQRAGIAPQDIGATLGSMREQNVAQRELEKKRQEALIAQSEASKNLAGARQRTEQETLQPRKGLLAAQTRKAEASALTQAGGSLNQQLNALTEVLGIEQNKYKDLLGQSNVGLSEEQRKYKTAVLEDSQSKITDLTNQVYNVIGEINKRGGTAIVNPIGGTIQATPRNEIVDTLKGLGVENPEQTVSQYIPQEGDVMMAPIDVQGTPPLRLPTTSERVALEQAPILQTEKRSEETRIRDLTNKADSQWEGQTNVLFRGNTQQLKSLQQAREDLTRKTDALGNPLTNQQRITNQITGIKSFVQGIDNSVVYPKELESAIAQSSSNLKQFLRNLGSWADNPQPLTNAEINGFLAAIDGRVLGLQQINNRLNQGQELYRKDYLAGQAKPLRTYIQNLDERKQGSLIDADLKNKIDRIPTGRSSGGAALTQSGSAQPQARKYKPNQSLITGISQ